MKSKTVAKELLQRGFLCFLEYPVQAAVHLLVRNTVGVNWGPALLTSGITLRWIERRPDIYRPPLFALVAKRWPRCFRPPCGKSLFIRKCNLLQEAGGRPRHRREGRLITGPDRWTATDWPAGWLASWVHGLVWITTTAMSKVPCYAEFTQTG